MLWHLATGLTLGEREGTMPEDECVRISHKSDSSLGRIAQQDFERHDLADENRSQYYIALSKKIHSTVYFTPDF